MQLYCQNCQAAFASASHCPRCGNRLLSPQESFITASSMRKPPPDPIPSSFGNRLITGSLFAVGLLFAMRELGTAFGLLHSHSLADPWNESNSEPITFALRLSCVLAGGLLAGAGRRLGFQVGAACGLLVGGLLTACDLYTVGVRPKPETLLLVLAYPLLGALAGLAGAWLWPADAVLPEPVRASSHGSSMARLAAEDVERRMRRPIAWVQIVVAAVLVTLISTTTDPIRMHLSKLSGGMINTGGVSKSALIGLQLASIAALLGGVLAGAATGAGLKNGVLAGLLTCAMLLIAASQQPSGLFPAVEGFQNILGMDREPLTTPRVAVNYLLCVTGMMSIAGALGGTLFPPLMPKRFRNRSLQRQC